MEPAQSEGPFGLGSVRVLAVSSIRRIMLSSATFWRVLRTSVSGA